jgi:TonB-dependent starch-binding outer membrane protein SusC
MRNIVDHRRIFKKYMVAVCFFAGSHFFGFTQELAMANTDHQIQQGKLKSVPLRVFMQQFQEATHIYFSYSSEAMKEKMVQYEEISKKSRENPGQRLNKVLKPAGLTYKKVDNVYIIIPDEKTTSTPASYSSRPVPPVDFTVSGVVKDVNGTNLGGITVQEKSTANMT